MQIISISLSDEGLKALDTRRGSVSRSKFITTLVLQQEDVKPENTDQTKETLTKFEIENGRKPSYAEAMQLTGLGYSQLWRKYQHLIVSNKEGSGDQTKRTLRGFWIKHHRNPSIDEAMQLTGLARDAIYRKYRNLVITEIEAEAFDEAISCLKVDETDNLEYQREKYRKNPKALNAIDMAESAAKTYELDDTDSAQE